MKASKFAGTMLLSVLLFAVGPAHAQGNSQDHGHGKGHEKNHGDDEPEDRGAYRYEYHQEVMRGWYNQSAGHLPPGLAKKDRLPPGVEKQLGRNGTLPPGLQKRLYPAPVELEERLPPPPPDCGHFLISGHMVLLNLKTKVMVDVFAF